MTGIKVLIGRKNRSEKMRWLYQNVKYPDKFSYMKNGVHRFLTHVYLSEDEYIVYKLKFNV